MQAGKSENRDPASREAGTLLSLIPLFISNYIIQNFYRQTSETSIVCVE